MGPPKKVHIACIDHPLGEKNGGEKMITRHSNIASTLRWCRFVFEATPWIVVCPWLSFVLFADDEIHRPKVMGQQAILLTRTTDIVVATGGWISPHMLMNRDRCARHRIPWIDTTELGRDPPDRDERDWLQWLVDHATLTIR